MSTAEIGVFGGSGFYAFLESTETVEMTTPYGDPSAMPVLGEIGGRSVAFIPRHGQKHQYPPHRIPYLANAWAMKELGVTRVLAPNACGSLQEHVKPGDFVICDQLVDRTRTRPTRSTTVRSPRTSPSPTPTAQRSASSRSPGAASSTSPSTTAARSS